jgi:hypothetical protein
MPSLTSYILEGMSVGRNMVLGTSLICGGIRVWVTGCSAVDVITRGPRAPRRATK